MNISPYPLETRNHARRLRYDEGMSYQEIADIVGCNIKTVRKWCIDLDEDKTDKEIIKENVRLSKQKQRLLDKNRVERKSFREYARAETMLEELHKGLTKALDKHKFSINKNSIASTVEGYVGIIQISDTHFNELIKGIDGNTYDFNIAANRLWKHVQDSKRVFSAHNVSQVVIALTGDLLNSDRRLDELTEAAYSRSNAAILVVDLISQVIQDLYDEYNVTVASIAGNESRIKEHVHFSDYLASDNYDIMIHNLLKYLYSDTDIEFVDITNPVEQVICVNGCNILMIHGNLHKGIARTPAAESEIEKIKSRFASNGTTIDYVIMGHIHSAFISDTFARSSGMPGQNAYSQRALNLSGRASQNCFIVAPDGAITGIKNDLQNVSSEDQGYLVNSNLIEYHSQTEDKLKNKAVVFQVVV